MIYSLVSIFSAIIPPGPWPSVQTCCLSNADLRDFKAIAGYVHKAEDYFEGGPRIRVDSLPPKEQAEYAATGEANLQKRQESKATALERDGSING